MLAAPAEHDPAPAGQATETPAEEPRSEGMGDGFLSDKSPGAPSSGNNGQPSDVETAGGESPAESEPANAELDQETRDGQMRQADYSKKLGQHAENVRQWEAEVRDHRQQMQAEREQFQALMQEQQKMLTTAVAGQQPGEQPQSAQIRSLASRAETREDREGLNFVADLAQTNEELRAELSELKETISGMGEKVETVATSAESLSAAQQRAREEEIIRQGQEATALFGETAIRDNQAFLERNIGLENPETGEAYSIAELIAMRTGANLEAARQAKAGNRQGRISAQRAAAPVGSTVAAPAPDGAPLSREQAIAQIAATQKASGLI